MINPDVHDYQYYCRSNQAQSTNDIDMLHLNNLMLLVLY